jgi:hypothetical protein
MITERYTQDEDPPFLILRRQRMKIRTMELEIRECREADVNNERKL